MIIVKIEPHENLLYNYKGFVGLEINPAAAQVITLSRRDPCKDLPALEIKVEILGKATKEGYWPQ